MSNNSQLLQYAKLLQAASRNNLLRRESNNKLLKKIVEK